MGLNANELMGCFDLSNPIEVVRTAVAVVDGGTLSEDPFHFCVGDGHADTVSKVSVEGAVGPNSQWVVTDEDGTILGLPPTPEAVNFDGAGPGICLIWHLSYADGLEGLEAGNNAFTDLTGVYDLSDDNVRVYRSQPEAGDLVGGPFEFTVDGSPDMVSGLSLSGERSGSNKTFVITDDQGKILGLPPTMEAVESVNFDGAGTGTCLIWYLRYEDGLQGAEMGLNANELMGCFDLSNPIEVVRIDEISTSGKSSAIVFPLPAIAVLNVSLKHFGNSDVQITMVDLAGNFVKNDRKKVNNSGISLDIQSVPSGLYILNITNGEGKSVSKKVIIR